MEMLLAHLQPLRYILPYLLSLTESFHFGQGSLRENSEQADEYVIPHGDWFDYVSSPHYLAEIVILSCPLFLVSFFSSNFFVIPRNPQIFAPNFAISSLMKVIYAGLVVASGGTDLTIWLLFAFVVLLHFLHLRSYQESRIAFVF